MTTDDIYNDLYGVGPGVIAAIIGFFTLVTPYGIVPSWWVLHYTFAYSDMDIIYPLLWALGPRFEGVILYPFAVYNPALLWTTLPLSLCNIIFAVKVMRYYQDRASKNSVLRWAFAAFIIPLLVTYSQGQTWILFDYLFDPTIVFGSSYYPYFGPIPIRIAVGLLVVFRIRAPELVTPWTDPERDESWWIEEELKDSHVGRLFIIMEELDEMYQIWEGEREFIVSKAYPLASIDDFKVQTPLIYCIKSKLIALLKKSSKSEAE